MRAHEIARTYIGETELPKNSGFTHAAFAAKMIDVGFQKGQAWCSYFGELCCIEAAPTKAAMLSALFDASAVKTLRNFEKAGYTKYTTSAPGFIAIFQTYINGVADWTGHLCIVSEYLPSSTPGVAPMMRTIDGNTNDVGGREGYIVAEKTRKVTFEIPPTGRHLVLIGFINPEEL